MGRALRPTFACIASYHREFHCALERCVMLRSVAVVWWQRCYYLVVATLIYRADCRPDAAEGVRRDPGGRRVHRCVPSTHEVRDSCSIFLPSAGGPSININALSNSRRG